MSVRSKLPEVGTTIFSVISRRALELGALNIGQGFPDYDIDARLIELVTQAMSRGHNQYAPMEGVLELRRVIAAKLQRCYGIAADPDREITVTCGGTEALYSAIQAVVGPGDEVIAFDPAYDSYEPAVRLAGARCVRIPTAPPDFRIDWERVRTLCSARTRLIILNNPHNPACTIATRDDLERLAGIAEHHGALVLADEVYEHVVYDGARHESVLGHARLRARSFVVFSFGKTLHATGWRVGYCVAPPELTAELRKVHQYNTFSITAPLQHGIAQYLLERPEVWRALAEFFCRKRDLLIAALRDTGFVLEPARGTYFQLIDYRALSSEPDVQYAERLLREAKVALIPLSPFYSDPPPLTHLRVCIAKRDETLELAARRLREFLHP